MGRAVRVIVSCVHRAPGAHTCVDTPGPAGHPCPVVRSSRRGGGEQAARVVVKPALLDAERGRGSLNLTSLPSQHRESDGRSSGHMSALNPALRSRVAAILEARSSRRQQLIDWHAAVKPSHDTSDADWRAHLDPDEYEVLRTKGTEPRGGEYDAFFPTDGGHFACRGCGRPLYSAAAKFKSGCGWPAFDKCVKDAVSMTRDDSDGMSRIEVKCAGCGGHQGHVFAGERMTPTNERHCVNSVSVLYVKGKPTCSASDSPSTVLAEEAIMTMQRLAKLS